MRATNHELLKRRIRQKDSEIRGLLQSIKNIDEVNDAKNQTLSELQSEKQSLQQQIIRQKQESASTVTKLQTVIHDYQSRLQELTDENVFLKNNLVFCVRIAILLMFLLIITPSIVRIHVENIMEQPIDQYNFVEWEEYQKLRIENEILLSQIDELNGQNYQQLDDGDATYERLQLVQQQLKYAMEQNEYLRTARIPSDDQTSKIEEMQELISDKNQDLLRYENELITANNEIERLQSSLMGSFSNNTSMDTFSTTEKIMDVSLNVKTNDSLIKFMRRPEIIQLTVFFIIAIMHYIGYKLWCSIKNVSRDWFLPSYWFQKRERKKWNRGPNGRLSSRYSVDFTLSKSKL